MVWPLHSAVFSPTNSNHQKHLKLCQCLDFDEKRSLSDITLSWTQIWVPWHIISLYLELFSVRTTKVAERALEEYEKLDFRLRNTYLERWKKHWQSVYRAFTKTIHMDQKLKCNSGLPNTAANESIGSWRRQLQLKWKIKPSIWKILKPNKLYLS